MGSACCANKCERHETVANFTVVGGCDVEKSSKPFTVLQNIPPSPRTKDTSPSASEKGFRKGFSATPVISASSTFRSGNLRNIATPLQRVNAVFRFTTNKGKMCARVTQSDQSLLVKRPDLNDEQKAEELHA